MQRSLARRGHFICPRLLHRARACQGHSWPPKWAVPAPIASIAIFTRALLGVIVVLVCTRGGPCYVVVIHVFHGDLIVHRLEVASALASFHSSSRWPHYLSTIFLLIFVARLVSWSTLFSCCLIWWPPDVLIIIWFSVTHCSSTSSLISRWPDHIVVLVLSLFIIIVFITILVVHISGKSSPSFEVLDSLLLTIVPCRWFTRLHLFRSGCVNLVLQLSRSLP